MKIIKKIITLEEVKQAYWDIEEEFNITAINFKFVHDCHFDDFTMTVEIMGEETGVGFFQETSPVAEYIIEHHKMRVNGSSSIEKKLLLSLFDPDLLQFLIQNKIPIHWNGEDEKSCQTIYFNTPDNILLSAMEM
nr:hypothetical protein [uncultured Desulfobacter sp.]